MKHHPSRIQGTVIPERAEIMKHLSTSQEGVIPYTVEIMKHHQSMTQGEVIHDRAKFIKHHLSTSHK